jgi:hypothetical protein
VVARVGEQAKEVRVRVGVKAWLRVQVGANQGVGQGAEAGAGGLRDMVVRTWAG